MVGGTAAKNEKREYMDQERNHQGLIKRKTLHKGGNKEAGSNGKRSYLVEQTEVEL